MGPQDVKTRKLWKIQIWAVVKNGIKSNTHMIYRTDKDPSKNMV